MTPEEVAAQIERMHTAEGAPPRLPGEKAVPPQGTALVGTESPPETFGATPAEVQAVRSAIEYIAGGPKENRIRQITEHAGEPSALEAPFWAAKTLESPQGQYRVGEEDVEGVRLGTQAAGAAMAGSMPFPRPTGSVGIFLGMPEAKQLSALGRKTAEQVLEGAKIMAEVGESHAAIRNFAHNRFKQAKENEFGTVVQAPNGEWLFEVATNKGKLGRLDRPKTPLGTPLEEIYRPNDKDTLFAAAPGIEETLVRGITPADMEEFFRTYAFHEPGELGRTAPPLVTGTPSEIGVRAPPYSTTERARAKLIRELQNEIFYRNQVPYRGGTREEFEEGGALAHLRLPGEEPNQAYNRLHGVRLAKAAEARSSMSPTALRKESVEQTLERLGINTAIEGIPAEYGGQRIRTHAENEDVMRGAAIGRLADRVAEGARQTLADMKAAGASPEEIAARLQKDYGSPVTADQVRNNSGWWNVPASGYSRWTAPQRALFLKLHGQGLPYAEIVRALRAIGRETNPQALKDTAHRFGLDPRQRGGPARGRGPARPARKDDET